MGVLLMSFEYQKAKQALNTDELQGIRLNDTLKRYTKRISNIETIFSKKKSQIESQFSQATNNAMSQISSAALGGNFSSVGSIMGIALSSLTNTTVSGDSKEAQLQSAQTIAAQLKSTLQTIMEQQKEAMLERLEAQEDKQKEPIAEKEAEFQGKVAANETITEIDKNRMDAAKSRLGEDIKNSTAHYGLA